MQSDATAPPSPSDLTGRWAMLQNTATLSKIPVIGEQRAATRSILMYDLVYNDGHLRGPGQLLDMRLDNGNAPVKISFPEAFQRCLPTPDLDARIHLQNNTLTFTQPKTWSVIGARLDDPVHDPLPTHKKDPRVWDQDGDGHPGVTVLLSGLVKGRVYVAQRSWSALTGRQTAPNRIEGQVTFNTEQVILGASNRLLKRSPAAHPDFARSFFTMIRLAPHATSADALAAFKQP